MNNLANIFGTETSTATVSRAAIAWTTQLNTAAEQVATLVVDQVKAAGENGGAMVQSMYDSVDTLKATVESAVNELQLDVEWLKDATTDEASRMLKSQQSKRSRSRSMQMTLTNFKKMVTAAAAEHYLRDAHELTTGRSGGHWNKVELVLTDEMIAAYSADQNKLSKAIRNIQSKKSIAKKKDGFDEQSAEWQDLLKFEESLKALRTTGSTVDPLVAEKAAKVDEAAQLLSTIDTKTMKKADLEEAINQMKELMMSSIN